MVETTSPQFVGLDKSRKALLVTLRDKATPILANNLLPHLTDHSVAHSDRLVELVCKLISPLQSTDKALNQNELLIVYAACYYHDIGLQYERAHELGVIPREEFSAAPWSELSENSKRTLLRRFHHRISAELVQRSASPTPLLGLQLTEDYHPSQVAALCAAHFLDTDSDEYVRLTADRPSVRMGLLSALLRLADILDESGGRALRAKADTLTLDIESQTHWWRHYYTRSVTFDTATNRICIDFVFPRKRLQEYARVVPELQMPAITDEFSKHRGILSKNDLAWHIAFETSAEPYSTTDSMPDRVLLEMLTQLRQKRSRQADAQRASDLQAFEEAQPLLRRQRDELESSRETLSPCEHLRRLCSLAEERWELGSKRAACMMLHSQFARDAGHLPAMERLEMALQLGEWLYIDDLAYDALRILDHAEDVSLSSEIAPSTRFRYWQLYARCASANADHAQADIAIDRALALTESVAEVAELQAERGEWRHLRGDHAGLIQDAFSGALVETFLSDAIADPKVDQPGRVLGLRVSAHVRYCVAYAKSLASLQGAEAATEFLNSWSDRLGADPTLDRVAIDLAKAEILYLDGQANVALTSIESLSEAGHDADRSDFKVMLLDNRAIVRFAQLQSDAEFYERYDWRTIRGMTYWNASKVLAGMMSAEKGKHYDALPAFWRQILHTYQGMSWQGLQWARSRMAHELLQIGHVLDAVWHAIAALDKQLAVDIGRATLAARNAELTKAVVARVLELCRLGRYTQMGIHILKEMMDAVPEEQIADVSELLLRSAAETNGDRGLIERLKLAWDAVTAVAPRLTEESRVHAVRAAIGHTMWSEPSLCRSHMVKAADQIVAHGIPKSVLIEVTDASIPLATTAKSDFDYTDVINLLCQLAVADSDAKQRIGDALFEGAEIDANVVLAQIGPLFGKRVNDLDRVVLGTVKQIRSQVQRLEPDEEALQTGYFTLTASSSSGRIAACLGAGLQSLSVIRRNLDRIPDAKVSSLLDAIVDMILDSDNLLDNRGSLIESLEDFVDRSDEKTAKRVWDVLVPFAKGDFAESTVLMTSQETQYPLSRVSMNSLTPSQLRGVALSAAAHLGRRYPASFGEEWSSLLDAALAERDAAVRQRALASTRHSSELSASVLAAVLLATQDQDAVAGRVAWLVLAEYEGKSVPDQLAHSIVYAARIATQHIDPSVRAAAASAMRNLRNKMSGHHGTQIAEIIREFAGDDCWSVRSRALAGAT